MKSTPVIIGVVVGGLVLVLLYFFWNKKGIKYQWVPTLYHDSKQPYGTQFVKKMLESYREEGTFQVNQKLSFHKLAQKEDFGDGETDLVLIGHAIFFDPEDILAAKEFLRAGNDIFVATSMAPEELIDSIYLNTCVAPVRYTSDQDSVLYTNFYHANFKRDKDYEFRFRMLTEDIPNSWSSIDPAAVCDSLVGFTPLGYQQPNHINFLKIPFEGKGNLYLHTEPMLFANYYMTQSDKVEYASSVFSHLSGKKMIWDEVSKLPLTGKRDNLYESPLYYIMQQPALKYAWWMLLAGALLYIIFASKRTQRVIPVIEAKTNTSLEFLNVISSLHYQNPNHLDMARKKMKYFLYFIRARYGINTQTFTEETAKRLSERSKVAYADIQQIHDRYKVIESYSISNDEPERLIGLYQAIEHFYKTCK